MRTELESIQNWFAYNEFARLKYFETLSKLPPEELTKDRGASFPTLLDILGHSIGGVETWIDRMSALNGEKFKGYQGSDPENLQDLRKYERSVQRDVDAFFARLTSEDLDRSYLVPKLPPWWDEDFTTTIRGTLLHVIEHELQHRGELNALLWQINVDPPIVDWDEYENSRAHTPHPKS